MCQKLVYIKVDEMLTMTINIWGSPLGLVDTERGAFELYRALFYRKVFQALWSSRHNKVA